MLPRRYRCADCGSGNFVYARCKVMRCQTKVFASDLCKKHYSRQWRYGHPLARIEGGKWGPFLHEIDYQDGTLMDMPKEEFWARVDRRPR